MITKEMKNFSLTRENTSQPAIANDKNVMSFIQLQTQNSALLTKELNQEEKMSKTEQEIRSSSIINRILDNCRFKVVPQKIKPLSKRQQLHHKFSQNETKNGIFQESQNKTSKMGAQLANSVITQIAKPLERTNLKQRSFSHVKPPLEETQKMKEDKSRAISMSALIDYNFRSIKSKNRIAINPFAAENQIQNKIKEAKRLSMASLVRSEKIRTKSQASHKNSQTENVIAKTVDNDRGEGDTTSYLRRLLKEKRNSTMVYGRMEKEYHSLTKMSKGVSNLEEAIFIMDQIQKHTHESSRPSKKIVISKKTKKLQQQKALNHRKAPSSSKRVCVSNKFSILNQ